MQMAGKLIVACMEKCRLVMQVFVTNTTIHLVWQRDTISETMIHLGTISHEQSQNNWLITRKNEITLMA